MIAQKKLALKLYVEKIKENDLKFDLLCGVPYGAIPLATTISMEMDKPMIFKRKDAKDHGLKNMIEGVFKPNDSCLLIDDVISSGISIIETIEVAQHQIRD